MPRRMRLASSRWSLTSAGRPGEANEDGGPRCGPVIVPGAAGATEYEADSEEKIMIVGAPKKEYEPLVPKEIAAWVRSEIFDLKGELDNPSETQMFGLRLLAEISEQLAGIRLVLERLANK